MEKAKPLLTRREKREILRNSGQFWTPSWVAEAMVEYVTMGTGKGIDIVFDPATGRGAMLRALLRLKIPNVSFFGIDIDNEVLADEIHNEKNCIVENKDFIRYEPNRKFKAIVANPPYIRHHRIDNETKLLLREISRRITGNFIDGRAGYHVYFLLLALEMLADGGRLAFILPSDTCEGKFSNDIWKWISTNFCIRHIITFNERATPFPKVDTNAIVIMIERVSPEKVFNWIRVNAPHEDELLEYIQRKNIGLAEEKTFKSLEITARQLEEGITTGLSRPEKVFSNNKYHLEDFATIMRGIATGSNEFFFLTEQRVKELEIPDIFFKRAIGRVSDISENILTEEYIEKINIKNRPTYLFSILYGEPGAIEKNTYPDSVIQYLELGEQMGLPFRPLLRQRKPWYKMEHRVVPPLLFSYLGRMNNRFIKNEAGVLPLTSFLCVYPKNEDGVYGNNLWKALNEIETLENLKFVGKSYGSGAIKVEPGNLRKLTIPEHIVNKYNLL